MDEKSLFEFSLSGYSLGMKTLVSGVYSLGPASIIYGTKEKFKILRYFCYHKTLKKKYEKNIKEYLFKINEIIDDSINHIIENSNDRTIFIPLSGGLDSRLIISKFHEKKYKNIKSFSYGLKIMLMLLLLRRSLIIWILNGTIYGLKRINLENFTFQILKKNMTILHINFRAFQVMEKFSF